MTVKHKLITLNRLLLKHAKYLPKKYSIVSCKIIDENIVIYKEVKNESWHLEESVIPLSDLDKTIKRYRGLIRYQLSENKKKNSEKKRKKSK